MKIIKKIVIPAKEEHIIEKEIYTCDFCGKEGEIRTCNLCGKHACWGYRDGRCCKEDPHEIGDYPDTYCPICYKLRYEKYEKEIDQIQLDADDKIETIIQKIKEESLKEYESRTN